MEEPINGVRYADEDVEGLMGMADRIRDVIYLAQLKKQYMTQVTALARSQQPISPNNHSALVLVETVETALRNLYDYSYLGDTPLGDLKLVRTRLSEGENTTIDR